MQQLGTLGGIPIFDATAQADKDKRTQELKQELESTLKFQQENIANGDFDIARELQADINYLKGKLGIETCEYSEIS